MCVSSDRIFCAFLGMFVSPDSIPLVGTATELDVRFFWPHLWGCLFLLTASRGDDLIPSPVSPDLRLCGEHEKKFERLGFWMERQSSFFGQVGYRLLSQLVERTCDACCIQKNSWVAPVVGSKTIMSYVSYILRISASGKFDYSHDRRRWACEEPTILWLKEDMRNGPFGVSGCSIESLLFSQASCIEWCFQPLQQHEAAVRIHLRPDLVIHLRPFDPTSWRPQASQAALWWVLANEPVFAWRQRSPWHCCNAIWTGQLEPTSWRSSANQTALWWVIETGYKYIYI